jgi:predicted nucleic acid-binding protein
MYLLDTDVLSELKKVGVGRAHPRVASWANKTKTAEYWISVVTIFEATRGMLLKERYDPIQAGYLRRWINLQVLPNFKNHILDLDLKTMQICAALHVEKTRPYRDSMIAATALVHGLTLATRNVKDFLGTGVTIINPWDEELL